MDKETDRKHGGNSPPKVGKNEKFLAYRLEGLSVFG